MKYYSMIRAKDQKFQMRLSLVMHARKHGIRETARAFNAEFAEAAEGAQRGLRKKNKREPRLFIVVC